MSHRCDICQFKDGHKGFKLVTCQKCNCHMHMECYGLTSRAAERFQSCFACKAVNQPVRGITTEGVIREVLEGKRPSSCALCSVTGGIHAMHPLFNDYGKKGRQLILPTSHDDKTGKLAWVHTLCALTICYNRRTLGSAYGCDILGAYEGDDNDNAIEIDIDDDDNETDGRDEAGEVSLHHFVICDETAEAHWNNIVDHRALLCIGCGKKDTNSLRIPVQCTAGDVDEYKEFSIKHRCMEGPCFQAMHVGCAMWGKNNGPYRRVYFFPGSGSVEPVVEVYCFQHAGDIKAKKKVAGGLTRSHTHIMVGQQKPPTVGLKQVLEGGGSRILDSPSKAVRSCSKTSSEKGGTLAPAISPKASRKKSNQKIIMQKEKPVNIDAAPKLPKRNKIVARTNSALERRMLAKSQAAALARSSSNSSVGERRGSTGSVPERRPSASSPQKRKPSFDISERRASAASPQKKKSSIDLSVPTRSNSSIPLPSGSIRKKSPSPALNKALQQLPPTSLLSLQAPDLTGVPKKRTSNPVRSVSSYTAATEATSKILNSKQRQRLQPTPAVDLPPPPAYQRVSSNVSSKTSKHLKVAKKRKSVVDDDDCNAVDFDDEGAEEKASSLKAASLPAAATTKPARVHRRYVSESKTDEEYYDDDFDWTAAMSADMKNIMSISKEDGNDLREVVEARKYFWKRKSGIFSSDFIDIWSNVMKKYEADLVDRPADEDAMTGTSIVSPDIAFNVNPDLVTSGRNKWSKLWNEQAPLFEFGDWDTSKEQMK